MMIKEQQKLKAPCFGLHLPWKEYHKLTELTQTLNMSKNKVIRKLLMDRADSILCNAPEILRKLDIIGHQLVETDQKIASILSQIERNPARDNLPSRDQKEAVISLINQSDALRNNIDASFREIISLLRNMT